jgi:hypothetical protein
MLVYVRPCLYERSQDLFDAHLGREGLAVNAGISGVFGTPRGDEFEQSSARAEWLSIGIGCVLCEAFEQRMQ